MSALGITIRPATTGDAEGVARVLNAVIEGGRHSLLDTPFSVEAERAFIASLPARSAMHVAEAGGTIVGFQVVEPWSSFVTHEFDHVATMGTYVDEAWRRRGVGTQLAAASFPAAQAMGYEKIYTDLRADNAESLAYHVSLGFTLAGAASRQARLGSRDVDVLFVERFL